MKKLIGAAATLIAIFVGLVVLLSLVPIENDVSYDDFTVDDGYEIIKADYDVKVSDDHTAYVKETITVRFYVFSRGISRWLPTNGGEQYSDVKVEGDEYYVTTEDGFICINTGDDYEYKYKRDDEKTYVISYNIVPPVKTINNTDYFMNVVPFGWTSSQSNVSVEMEFPYEIKDLIVYSGKYGSTQTTEDYNVSGNKLSMRVDYLAPLSGVSVDAELGRKFNVNFSIGGLISILLILIFIIISLVVKLIFLKDRQIFPVINSKPPLDGGRELDPAEMGFLIDGNCESKDITSMIFYFASQKLITIENIGDDKIMLHKRGELPVDAPKHQKTIFDGLFKSGDNVTTDELQDVFYTYAVKASSEIKNKHSELYESGAKSLSYFLAGLGGTLFSIFLLMMAARVNVSLVLRGVIIPIAVGVIILIASYAFGRYVFNYKHKINGKKLILKCIGAEVVAILASLLASYFLLGGILPFYARAVLYVGLPLIGFICGLINRKTEYYASIMNEITGFKTYLESAEKSELEAMLTENPSYYYDILPYTNVLGVSDMWEEKFKDIANVPPPEYYYGTTFYDFLLLNSLFRHSFITFNAAMISRPNGSSMSGGGFRGGFGGGFGGGGFGGGGGGRR